MLLMRDPAKFFRRLRLEFDAPSTKIFSSIKKIHSSFGGGNNKLLFIYDTLLNPITFDFVHYLYLSECLRSRLGCSNIDVLIVNRDNFDINREERYSKVVSNENIKWRIANIIFPVTRLFPKVSQIFFLNPFEVDSIISNYSHIYPKGYNYYSPKKADSRLDSEVFIPYDPIRVSDTAKSVIDSYFPIAEKRKIITVTLRSYGYIEVRNSNLSAWLNFAKSLDKTKYRIVFIPDASPKGITSIEDLLVFDVFDAAAWNLELRAAIYSRAWMNMGVTCGPLSISGIMAKPITIMIDRIFDCPADYREGIAADWGITPGEKPKFYSENCYFYPGKDDLETILEIFRAHSDN